MWAHGGDDGAGLVALRVHAAAVVELALVVADVVRPELVLDQAY